MLGNSVRVTEGCGAEVQSGPSWSDHVSLHLTGAAKSPRDSHPLQLQQQATVQALAPAAAIQHACVLAGLRLAMLTWQA